MDSKYVISMLIYVVSMNQCNLFILVGMTDVIIRRCSVSHSFWHFGKVDSIACLYPEVIGSRLVAAILWVYVSLGKTLNGNCSNPVVTNGLY